MNVLIGCEFSAVVRDAFIARGHNAWSCDLLQTEGRQGNHFVGDVLRILDGHIPADMGENAIDIRTGRMPVIIKWDLFIAHPDCTFLCNSGVRWLFKGGKSNGRDLKPATRDETRWNNMLAGAQFFAKLASCKIPKIAIENPIMHGHGRHTLRQWGIELPEKPQIVQPWQFGHEEMKATCLWLKNLPPLVPTKIVGPPPTDKKERAKWARVHRASPGPDRWKERARTLPGIAAAMAEQWGRL